MFVSFLFVASNLKAQLMRTQEDALKLAFPTAKVERLTVFLTETQVEQIQKLAHVKLESKLVTYYVGRSGSEIAGFAFFEKNTVRTKEEIFMVVLNPDGSVRFVEMLAFYEPFDYLPTSRWLKLFGGKSLTDGLWPGREIHNITGATLTARAVTLGVRKVLATFKLAVHPEIETGQVQEAKVKMGAK